MADDQTLALLGVSGIGEQLYRRIVASTTTTAAEIAQAFDLSQERAVDELEQLRALGLVNRLSIDENYSAVDPRFGIRVLVDRTADRLNRIRDAVPDLGAAFDEAERVRSDPSLSRILSGHDEVAAWYTRLEHQAGSEFLAFDRPPYVLADTNPLEEVVLERGVVWRAIYAAASFTEDSALDDVRRLVARGEDARITSDLPIKMAIADRRIALVSLELSAVAPVALVTQAAPMVEALIELFEWHWGRAAPVPLDQGSVDTRQLQRVRRDLANATPAPVDGDVTAERPSRAATETERTLLALFSTGLKDEQIARQLGISARTVRRRSHELLRELGAANRFQAGAEAARRGWI